MGIILFILIFSVVVIAHEFGHFIVAKSNGINVVEFSVGMGPCIFSATKGGTRYAIRLLPIGGACMFEGEDGKNFADDSASDGNTQENEDTQESLQSVVQETKLDQKSGAFPDASVMARIATVAAGPIFNFILAFLFALIIISSYGIDLPVIQMVAEDGAAMAAGLKDGDTILSLDNKKIHIYREISLYSMLNRGEDIAVSYERDGQIYNTVISPIYNPQEQRYYMGLYGQGQYEKQGLLGGLKYSTYEVKYWIGLTIKSLEMMVQGKVSKDDVSGPVGMAQAVDQIYNDSKPDGIYYIWLNMLSFAILLSANLGVLNLLPVPALDGGRLVFLFVELVRGKPIPPEKEGIVHLIGMACLMLLMAFVFVNDISRLFR